MRRLGPVIAKHDQSWGNVAMEIKRCRLFVALAEELHFGRAAARAGVAQSVLSVQIRRLEDELGVRLFTRTRRHVLLTPVGTRLLPEVRAVLDRVDQVHRVARALASGKEEVVRVAMTTVALLGDAPALVGAFRDAYGNIDVEIREMGTVDQEGRLARREIDLGFLHPPLDRIDLRCLCRADSDFIAVKRGVAPACREWAEVLRDPIVFYGRRRAPRLYDAFISAASACGVTPMIAAEASSFLSAIGAASSGGGTALAPREMGARLPRYAAASEIVGCPLKLQNAVAIRSEEPSPAALALHDFIRGADEAGLIAA